MTAQGVRRVRVHVPAHDGWPESVRGVGSLIVCSACGVKVKGSTHAKVREAWRAHRAECRA